MRKIFFITMLFAFISSVQASRTGVLFLRGRVEPFTNIKNTPDGFIISSNTDNSYFVKLHKKGKGFISLSGEEKLILSKRTLLKEGVELIQIEAP